MINLFFRLCTIRTVGFVIQNTNSRAPDIAKIIFDTNKLLSTTNFKTKWFDDLEAYDIVLEYLLNLAVSNVFMYFEFQSNW